MADDDKLEMVALIDKQSGRLVAFYAHEEFIGAMNTAILETVDQALVGVDSTRRMFRALSRMRTESAHAGTLARALAILRECGTALPVSVRNGEIVATFPA